MRDITSQDITVNGKTLRATLISDPNIDDVVIAEAETQAFAILTNGDLTTHRVSRDVRDLLLRFGVQR